MNVLAAFGFDDLWLVNLLARQRKIFRSCWSSSSWLFFLWLGRFFSRLGLCVSLCRRGFLAFLRLWSWRLLSFLRLWSWRLFVFLRSRRSRRWLRLLSFRFFRRRFGWFL